MLSSIQYETFCIEIPRMKTNFLHGLSVHNPSPLYLTDNKFYLPLLVTTSCTTAALNMQSVVVTCYSINKISLKLQKYRNAIGIKFSPHPPFMTRLRYIYNTHKKHKSIRDKCVTFYTLQLWNTLFDYLLLIILITLSNFTSLSLAHHVIKFQCASKCYSVFQQTKIFF